ITYSLGALSNSNPAPTILGQDAATPAAVARLDRTLGLDHPLIVQYWHWLTQAVQGNLGRSWFTQIPVAQSIAQRLPVDLSIALLAVVVAVLLGGTAGIVGGVRRGRPVDRLAAGGAGRAPRRHGRHGGRGPPGRLVRPRAHAGLLDVVHAAGP